MVSHACMGVAAKVSPMNSAFQLLFAIFIERRADDGFDDVGVVASRGRSQGTATATGPPPNSLRRPSGERDHVPRAVLASTSLISSDLC
jgi:hypothetical protein